MHFSNSSIFLVISEIFGVKLFSCTLVAQTTKFALLMLGILYGHSSSPRAMLLMIY